MKRTTYDTNSDTPSTNAGALARWKDRIARPEAYREKGEGVIEVFLYSYRWLWMLLILVGIGFLGFHASKIKPDAGFEKMIPAGNIYVQNFLDHRDELKGGTNVIRIVIETTEKDIFTAEYMDTLRQIHDEVFYIPGVDRAGIKSLWAPSTRWVEVTEDGFIGGPVIPDTYDGSERSLDLVYKNILKAGGVGLFVANNYKSSVIILPLRDTDPISGEKLDYHQLSSNLEELIRDKYQSESVKIHIIGFAKLVGDLIDGASEIVIFFAASVVLTAIMLLIYSRSITATLLPIACSLMAVFGQLGILQLLGKGLDPYSMLVPFLIFAIGVSHAIQIINQFEHELVLGHDKVIAAKRTFRALYIPGVIALISDGVGFATLSVVEIQVIRDLALGASIGVALIILTNLILLPIIISYVGINRKVVDHRIHQEITTKHPIWRFVAHLTTSKNAPIMLCVMLAGFGYGAYKSLDLKIGDLDKGAPELHPDSRYNLDTAFLADNYSTSTDVFVVMAKTPDDMCANHHVLDAIDQLQWSLRHVEGVQDVKSLVDFTKLVVAGINEGSLKWHALINNNDVLNNASSKVPKELFNEQCNFVPVFVFLNDHKADTLDRVIDHVEAFTEQNVFKDVEFLMAAGNAGIEAATNRVIDSAQYQMLALVYAVVIVLCFIAFRSWRAVACIIIPLALTSLLCQALMVHLGIGVKVATLPVIALGVGIGVDYGIYIFSKLREFLNDGMTLENAYLKMLTTTGQAVAFTGVTLGLGVVTWAFSAIKFQADMGILLTFMFILNMIGALIFLPVLAKLLLVQPEEK